MTSLLKFTESLAKVLESLRGLKVARYGRAFSSTSISNVTVKNLSPYGIRTNKLFNMDVDNMDGNGRSILKNFLILCTQGLMKHVQYGRYGPPIGGRSALTAVHVPMGFRAWSTLN